MSSIVDANINLENKENEKLIIIAMDLSKGNTTTVDLTKFGGDVFNNLDFIPDYMILKGICFSSDQAVAGNSIPILKCNFTTSEVLAPFLARTSNNVYHLRFKTNWDKCDIRNCSFTHCGLTDSVDENCRYTQGSLMISINFIRYTRYLE